MQKLVVSDSEHESDGEKVRQTKRKVAVNAESVKIEKSSNLIDIFESDELTVPHTIEPTVSSTRNLRGESKRPNVGASDEPDIKFIKLETEDALELDDAAFAATGSDDETEQYLEEQYLDNYSDVEDNTEVEYVYEDDVDDENCNSFREEYLKGDDAETVRQHVKRARKPKTPKVKKFITERVLDADTMKEYDAVKCLNCSEYFETMDKFTAHQ